MKYLIAIMFLFMATACNEVKAATWITENVNGGFIVLTEQECPIAEWKELYPYKAIFTKDKTVHFTETDPNKIVLGCYTLPLDKPPMQGMFPIVSIIVQDPFTKEVYKNEHPITIYSPLQEINPKD